MNQKELGLILNYSQSVVCRLIQRLGYERALIRPKADGSGIEIVRDLSTLVPEIQALLEK